MKILHIDDNFDVIEPIQLFFEAKGDDFDTCLNGKTGINMIKNNVYDLVFLDLSMPEFSGYDVLKQLTDLGLKQKTKIIVFTAHTLDDKAVKELLDLGAHSIIEKPILIDVLEAKLELINENTQIL